jgi:uncharacterized membrane protein YcaP (DUF421 family)
VFFDSWQGVGRVIVVGSLAYSALIVLLRVSGKRTLTKMNAFDLVVTVALGSTLATILLSKDVALVEGVVAFALLVALQFVVTYFSVRSETVRHLVKSEPSLLLYRGRMLDDALRKQRVTEEEVRAAIRSGGISKLTDVEAVVLETDGSFTVLNDAGQLATSARQDVAGYPAG